MKILTQIKQWIEKWQRIRRVAKREFRVDTELYQTLRELAWEEQRSTNDVAADLISSAINRQYFEWELMQRWQLLTAREREVTHLVLEDYTNSEIAAQLFISVETAKTHVRNVLRKFGVHTRGELRLLLAGWQLEYRDEK